MLLSSSQSKNNHQGTEKVILQHKESIKAKDAEKEKKTVSLNRAKLELQNTMRETSNTLSLVNNSPCIP